MMNKRTHRIISLFFAILLFLSGMHADTVATEALFVYNLTGKMATGLAPCHSDINDATICSEMDLLNMCSVEQQSPGRYQERAREVNDFLYLQCSGFGFLSQGKSCMHRVMVHLSCRRQNELVIDYLHQSDGKKRIENCLGKGK